ncbi:50S ribosomal protein L4 [Lentisphaerota bacterium WC36G]|nr:50S ribosomal protein L4 [Lentisphaerae bacterium WC36]
MSRKLDILDITGKVVGDYAIAETNLEFEKGVQAVHDCVVAFLAGLRAGTACTKTRGERRGGGAKPWKQKGLGRARTGSIRNPIWRKGGVIFGPKPRDYSKKVNKKVKTLALKRSFTDKILADSVKVVNEFAIADSKTKSAVAALDNMNIDKSVLLVVDDYSDNVVRATGNISNLLMIKASSVNVYQLLYFDKVLFTKDALDKFIERLG